MNATRLNHPYLEGILAQMPYVIDNTHLPFPSRVQGKVRDIYDLGAFLLLVSTDRLSAFDRAIARIPCKGQVLNLTSAWWFEHTKTVAPNHLVAIPHPNAAIVKKCKVFPIECVVRGYITGSTDTSLWMQYQNGVREYCGHVLDEGMQKNQALKTPLLTPTTKDAHHDRPISAQAIVASGLMSEAHWQKVSQLALALYQKGVDIAREKGLILVDTKYEFGVDEQGHILVVDELHTPDSSRYWREATYASRMAKGLEPENMDKEFLRLWFAQNTSPYENAPLPEAPEALVLQLALKYIQLYECITGQTHHFARHDVPVEQAMVSCVNDVLRRC